MRIIGIDPGFERTGFAILELEKNGKITVLDCGQIFTDKALPFARRLQDLSEDLKTILTQWKPIAAGVENIFFSKNTKTAIKVSHARGVMLELLEEHGVPIFEFNPNQIKMTAAGHGHATKQDVKKMIQYTLGISLKNDDTADAIACGICLLTMHRNDILMAHHPA